MGIYTAYYVTGYQQPKGPDYSGTDIGYQGQFQVFATPPTKPGAAPGPAFGWQGSVGGVNTGNGNKTTSVPLTGWTQRGGMAISCAMYHNSQGSVYGPWGNKWVPTYFSYITTDGSGNPTLHWDNGQTYTYTSYSGNYIAPSGILDALTAPGSGTYAVTTPGKVVYTFGFTSGGNAYLSKITDTDGNTLTINHNSDTTLSTIVDATGRTLTFTYSGGKLSSVTDPLGRAWGFTYGAAGGTGTNNLWYITLPSLNGGSYAVWFGYDSNSNIIGQQTPQGHALNQTSTFGYDTSSPPRLAWAQDPLGSRTTFAYGASTTSITDPNGFTTTHTYNDSDLVSVTDPTSKTSSTAYDYNNIAYKSTDRRGYVSTFSSHFTNGSSTSTSTDPLNNSSSSTYDGFNKVIGTLDAVGNTTATTYSTDGHEDLLSSKVTGTGTSPFTATSSVGGYSNGLPTTFTDALNWQSSVGYNANGDVTSAKDANSNTSGATYNALGWKLTGTDGLNHTTSTTYDNWGRITSVTAPDNTVTSTVYDLDGNVLRVSDADASPLTLTSAVSWTAGLTGSALSFNGTGGAAASTTTLGNFGTGAFSVSCWVKTSGTATQILIGKRLVAANSSFWDVYLQNGAACMELDGDTSGTNYLNLVGTRLINNGAWHLITAVRSGASVTLFVDGTQDVTGSPAGPTTLVNTAPLTLGYTPAFGTYYYAGLLDEARVYSRALSGSEISSLAQQSPAVSTANELQSYWSFNEGSGTVAYDACHSVVNTYDADDRLLTTTNGRGDVVSYTYDGPTGYGSLDTNGQTQKGLLSKKTDGNGHVTTYTYTGRSEPYQTFYADGTSESVTYDENGNVKTRTKADGKVITYTYDADNRLTDIAYPTLHAVHFGYDADGRQTSMTDGTGTTTYTYGDGLHLTQTVTPQGTVNYSYDADGRRTQVNTPAAGSWGYSFDPGGRLTQILNPYSEKTLLYYDNADNLKQKTKGDGDYETYAYDTANQLTGIGYYWSDGTGRNFHTYGYDPAGKVVSDNQGFFATVFGYDGADQQTSEISQGSAFNVSLAYTYDHNGNRLTQAGAGGPAQSFVYDGHDKLTSGSGGETEGYDLNGNKTGMSVGGVSYTYSYDDEDRLTKITSSQGLLNTFSYNGLGLRVGKTDSTGNYVYTCDGTSPGSPVLSDLAAVYTPGQSEHRGSTSYFYANDRQGNLWTLDTAGKGQSFYQDTSGFGALTAWGGSTSSQFKFGGGNGCQTDADTGLVLMGHRYYDTRLGRFITQDPIGDGDNWYAYAGNDPIDAADPSGLVTKQEAQDGAAAYTNGDPGIYDFWQVTNGDYAHAKYLYTVAIGFESLYNFTGGLFGTNVMNFPGGSSMLMRNIHAAQAAARNAAPNFNSKYPPGITSALKSILLRGIWFEDMVHGPDKKTHIAGAWDIKQGVDRVKDPVLFDERRNAGDFMYGATGDAARMGSLTLQFFAGYAQFRDDNPRNALSYWQTGFDDPEGHGEILAGMAWYDSGAHTYSLAVP